MHSNAKMELLRKCVGTLFSYVDLSPRYYVNILSMGNPLIPDASEFKNRYVTANINLWSIKIIVSISLKVICKEKM